VTFFFSRLTFIDATKTEPKGLRHLSLWLSHQWLKFECSVAVPIPALWIFISLWAENGFVPLSGDNVLLVCGCRASPSELTDLARLIDIYVLPISNRSPWNGCGLIVREINSLLLFVQLFVRFIGPAPGDVPCFINSFFLLPTIFRMIISCATNHILLPLRESARISMMKNN